MREKQSTEDLRILVAGAHGHLPQETGGVQSSTHDLVRALAPRVQSVGVLCALKKSGALGFAGRIRTRFGHRLQEDGRLGYRVFRSFDALDSVPAVVKQFMPHCAIVQSMHAVPLARRLVACGVPVVFYFRNAELDQLRGDPAELDALFLSNSQFTSNFFEVNCGITSVVVPPIVRWEKYYVGDRQANTVLFVNPIAKKGVDIALALAEACPDIPFCFVQAWGLEKVERCRLLRSIKSLRNVDLVKSREDMRPLYARAKIVLAPSRWEEAWGRIATEAHINAIPVLASSRGGLPEAVGPGGVIIDIDAPLAAWESELRRMWSDDSYFNRLSGSAALFSRRPAVQEDAQVKRILELITTQVGRRQ